MKKGQRFIETTFVSLMSTVLISKFEFTINSGPFGFSLSSSSIIDSFLPNLGNVLIFISSLTGLFNVLIDLDRDFLTETSASAVSTSVDAISTVYLLPPTLLCLKLSAFVRNLTFGSSTGSGIISGFLLYFGRGREKYFIGSS